MSDTMLNSEAVADSFRKKVNAVNIDWNKWHKIVKESLDATQFDEIATVCGKLGICEPDDGGLRDVKSGEIRSTVEHVIETIIRLYELKWNGKEGTRRECYELYGSDCCVYREYDTKQAVAYYGRIELAYRATFREEDCATFLSHPYIEVAIEEAKDGEIWFEIRLILVGQVF